MNNKKILESLDDIVTFREEPTSEQIEALMEAMDIVEKYSKIGGWIPCSERLPKKSGEYIVMISGAELPTCLNFLSSDNSWFDTEKDYEVLYWQPLPEAYHG